MEEIREALILQVRTWLEENKLVNVEKHTAYRHFVGQCDQYGITEEQFYLEILSVAYKGAHFDLSEDPDPPNPKHTHVTIFGEKLHSLKKLGQVLFDNPQKSTAYFEDMSLIKSHLDALSTGDDALEYANIYKSESNPDKRYLKIVYHLNPKLPYRIGTKKFNTLEEIIEKAFEDRSLYNQLYNEYVLDKLWIWLNESDPERASTISGGRSYNAFLRFIYSINANYPFYLGSGLYANPQEIVEKAGKDIAFRQLVYEHLVNDQLFTWFDCIGWSDWQLQYIPVAERLAQKNLKEDNLAHASVQKLIRIIDKEIQEPKLKSSESQISYTNLEASKGLSVPITISLVNNGFVNVVITRDAVYDGIWLDQSEVTFFDLGNLREFSFNLMVAPLLLTKDKLYRFNIQLITDYEQLNIPVELKTVFPLKSFITYLVKYAAFFFVAFAGLRFALQSFTKNTEWLNSEWIVEDLENYLPNNYGIYIFLLLVFVALGLLAYPLIRKFEKI